MGGAYLRYCQSPSLLAGLFIRMQSTFFGSVGDGVSTGPTARSLGAFLLVTRHGFSSSSVLRLIPQTEGNYTCKHGRGAVQNGGKIQATFGELYGDPQPTTLEIPKIKLHPMEGPDRKTVLLTVMECR